MNDAEWRQWRRGGIGASDVPGIMGVSPYSSPWSIWAEKVGLTTGPAETPAMTFGRDLEAVIATWFTRSTDLHVTGEQTMCTHRVEHWARATVDGFVCEPETTGIADALGTYEAKWTGRNVDELPEHYALQAQWQMFVTDLPAAWVAVMATPFGRPRFTVHELARDEVTIARCVDVCGAFWHDLVLTGTPPPADATDATSKVIRDVYGADRAVEEEWVELDDIANLVERLGRTRDNRRQIERDILELENTIKARLGTATAGTVDDEVVVTWRTQSRRDIDRKALRAAEPELYEKFTTESSFRVLRLKEAS